MSQQGSVSQNFVQNDCLIGFTEVRNINLRSHNTQHFNGYLVYGRDPESVLWPSHLQFPIHKQLS